jgi:hypothetical protein
MVGDPVGDQTACAAFGGGKSELPIHQDPREGLGNVGRHIFAPRSTWRKIIANGIEIHLSVKKRSRVFLGFLVDSLRAP